MNETEQPDENEVVRSDKPRAPRRPRGVFVTNQYGHGIKAETEGHFHLRAHAVDAHLETIANGNDPIGPGRQSQQIVGVLCTVGDWEVYVRAEAPIWPWSRPRLRVEARRVS